MLTYSFVKKVICIALIASTSIWAACIKCTEITLNDLYSHLDSAHPLRSTLHEVFAYHNHDGDDCASSCAAAAQAILRADSNTPMDEKALSLWKKIQKLFISYGIQGTHKFKENALESYTTLDLQTSLHALLKVVNSLYMLHAIYHQETSPWIIQAAAQRGIRMLITRPFYISEKHLSPLSRANLLDYQDSNLKVLRYTQVFQPKTVMHKNNIAANNKKLLQALMMFAQEKGKHTLEEVHAMHSQEQKSGLLVPEIDLPTPEEEDAISNQEPRAAARNTEEGSLEQLNLENQQKNEPTLKEESSITSQDQAGFVLVSADPCNDGTYFEPIESVSPEEDDEDFEHLEMQEQQPFLEPSPKEDASPETSLENTPREDALYGCEYVKNEALLSCQSILKNVEVVQDQFDLRSHSSSDISSILLHTDKNNDELSIEKVILEALVEDNDTTRYHEVLEDIKSENSVDVANSLLFGVASCANELGNVFRCVFSRWKFLKGYFCSEELSAHVITKHLITEAWTTEPGHLEYSQEELQDLLEVILDETVKSPEHNSNEWLSACSEALQSQEAVSQAVMAILKFPDLNPKVKSALMLYSDSQASEEETHKSTDKPLNALDLIIF